MDKELITLRGRTYQPQVIVQPEVYDVLGEPEVDFDGLEELFYRDLGIAIKHEVVIDFYEAHHKDWWGYFDAPNTINVRPIRILKGERTLIETLLHEGQHMADYLSGAWQSRLSDWTRPKAISAGEFVGKHLSKSYGNSIENFYYKIDPCEARARQTEAKYELTQKYANVVKFNKFDEDALYIFGPNHNWRINKF